VQPRHQREVVHLRERSLPEDSHEWRIQAEHVRPEPPGNA
jgi:hypothetical protein